MRVFLCVFKDFSVAIPMAFISSLYLHTEETVYNEAVIYNPQTQDFFVSLFCLFNLPSETTRHGIVLKNEINDINVTLLSTQVDSEIEIPDNKIYPMPKAFKNMSFSCFFDGIQFSEDTKSKPLLFLNPEQLIHYIIRKKL